MSLLYGLVVCGGRSTRMGRDKSLLNYHGKPQRYHLYELMKPLCDRVFICCNAQQVADIPSEYEILVDDEEYSNIGPKAALATAYKRYPQAGFMLVGCDYPYFRREQLHVLSKAILNSTTGASYLSKSTNFFEPLLSGFQTINSIELNEKIKQSNWSLQQIFKTENIDVIIPKNEMEIMSIDTEDEYRKVMMQLHSAENNNTI